MKKTLKRVLLWIASAFMFLSVIGLVLVMPAQKKTASAAGETTWQTGTFAMEDGVSLKLGIVGGLRFRVIMDETVATFVKETEGAELGFVLAPQVLMEEAKEAGGNYLNMPKKIGDKADKNKIYEENGTYYANACITNIKGKNLALNFTAVAYIKYGETVRYTDYNVKARNNAYDTVNMAVLGGYGEAILGSQRAGGYAQYGENTGWYGSESFPILVENTEEYDAVINLVNKDSTDLSGYHMVVENSAVPSLEFGNAEYRPTIKSLALDNVNKLISGLPNSVTMPDAIGMIGRIRDAEKQYNALSEADKEGVENYAKLESLLTSIRGYDRVWHHDVSDDSIIPCHVVENIATIGGTGTIATDEVYGNYLIATPNAGGAVSVQFKNFPDVSAYESIYFYVRHNNPNMAGCYLYYSEDLGNGGWGSNWVNNFNDISSNYGQNQVANNWSLIKIDVSTGILTSNWALGLWGKQQLSELTTLEITDVYAVSGDGVGSSVNGVTLGVHTDTGTTNEYGKVYNLTQDTAFSDDITMGWLPQNEMANALPDGYEYFYFWMYNPLTEDKTFHLAGDVNGTWTDSKDYIKLKAGAWTKVVISNEDIQYNTQGQWFLYINDGGVQQDGWQISPIYVGPDKGYTDNKDVKDTIALIAALPETVTLADKEAVDKASAAYETLRDEQKALVTNLSKLENAKATIESYAAAQEVINLIDSIDAENIDVDLVVEARAEYEALPAIQKNSVTNLAKLESYERAVAHILAAREVQSMIAVLPDSVTMPDHLVFVSRIEAARDAYDALSYKSRVLVDNYATKLNPLLKMIQGYETVHVQTVEGVNVIPNYLKFQGYTSETSGTATLGYDGSYGNYLQVTSAEDGTAAIQFKNFPDVSKYTKIYFNIKVVGASCDIHLSAGTSNNGLGEGEHSTQGISGFWVNDNSWIQKEVDTSTGIFTSDLALGFKTNTRGISFMITDIVGYVEESKEVLGLAFGEHTNATADATYGTVYTLNQLEWAKNSATDFGAFVPRKLGDYLTTSIHDSYKFWIYNPNPEDVTLSLSGDMNNWNASGKDSTTLKAQAWTQVIITPEQISLNDRGTWYVNMSSGANTAGWKITNFISFTEALDSNDRDKVDEVQALIDALNPDAVTEANVTAARTAYEALSEQEKTFINAENLLDCEEKLYGDVENAPFVVESATQYQIYVDYTDRSLTSGIRTAAKYMVEQIKAKTDATLTINDSKPVMLTKYSYAIVFGYEDLYEQLGLELPSENVIGFTGYALQRVGRTVYVLAYGEDGYRMGMLALLREVIGYDMISEDCIVYSKDGTTLPQMSKVEKPAFEYRQAQTKLTDAEIYGMGLHSNTDIWISSEQGWDMHNVLHYLPLDPYGETNASWYNVAKTQICPTAGGDSAQYTAMVNKIVEGMVARINALPTIENICFSVMDSDGNDACTCTRCSLYTSLYGSFTAAWIDLMNDVNAGIRAQIGDRKIQVAFMAYRSTESAPASIDGNGNVTLMKRYEINDDGSYTQTSEDFKCDDGVAVWIAPINAKYAENLNHADNAAHLATIKKWTKLSQSVYVMAYGTNYVHFLYPYNSWKASAENYKILADLGVKYAWTSSIEQEGTAFTDLKGYIDSVFMRDVNADYETVLTNYFTNYFGPAATSMRNMFNAIVAKCDEIESSYNGLGRGIYDDLNNIDGGWFGEDTIYWSEDCLNELLDYISAANTAIDDSSLDEAMKATLRNRVLKESLFPRYVLYKEYGSSYGTGKTNREQFEADCAALGVTHYSEKGTINDGNLWE